MISIALEVIETSGVDLSEVQILLNHTSFLGAVLDAILVSPDQRMMASHILEYLDRPHNIHQIRNQLVKICGIPTARAAECLEYLYSLTSLSTQGQSQTLADFTNGLQRVDDFLSSRSSMRESAISNLTLLAQHLIHLGIKSKLVFAPLMSHNCVYYEGACYFQIVFRGRKLGM